MLSASDATYLIGEILTRANVRGELAAACSGARQVTGHFPEAADQPTGYTTATHRTPGPEIVITFDGPNGPQKVRLTVELLGADPSALIV